MDEDAGGPSSRDLNSSLRARSARRRPLRKARCIHRLPDARQGFSNRRLPDLRKSASWLQSKIIPGRWEREMDNSSPGQCKPFLHFLTPQYGCICSPAVSLVIREMACSSGEGASPSSLVLCPRERYRACISLAQLGSLPSSQRRSEDLININSFKPPNQPRC